MDPTSRQPSATAVFPATTDDGLRAFLGNSNLLASGDADDRYVALLQFVATRFAPEFADFVSHQDSARRYLGLGPAEWAEARAQHVTRQVPGTHFWAVMNLGDDVRARFVRRLLDYVGATDGTVSAVLDALQLPDGRAGFSWPGAAR